MWKCLVRLEESVLLQTVWTGPHTLNCTKKFDSFFSCDVVMLGEGGPCFRRWGICMVFQIGAGDLSSGLSQPGGKSFWAVVVAKRAKDGFLQCSQWGSRKQEFQMSKLDFIIRITKPRQWAHNVCISVCPLTFYTCGTAQTWEFLFLIGYACLTCHQ